MQMAPKWEKQFPATAFWESLSSFYCELGLFVLFQKKNKKKLLKSALNLKLLEEEAPLSFHLCSHSVEYRAHQTVDANSS